MKLRGIIFDLDGTIGDTLPICFTAFRKVLREFLGREFSDAEIRSRFGPSEEGMIAGLLPDRAADCLDRYLQEYTTAHHVCRAPFAGLPEVFELLQTRGIRLAIVTGKGPRSAAISLDAMGLNGAFRPVVAGSPAGGVKPESMRRVLEAWGFAAAQVASIGDSPSDIRAARQLGLAPLAAAWAATADYEQLRSLEPQETFRTVAAFDEWVRGKLA